MNLRPYQKKAVDQIRNEIKKGNNRILLFLATGGGKSVILKYVITSLSRNNQKILFIVRRRGLVFQIKEKHLGHLDSSIVMGNEKGLDPNSNLQICSVDTVARRIGKKGYEFLNNFDYVLCDEAHDCTSGTYREILNKINSKVFIGVTASPFHIGNKGHTFWQTCVKPIEMHELREQGYLADARVFAPKKIDTSQIKKVAGDFHQGDLSELVSSNAIVGDVVDTYKKYGQGKPALLFAVNISHSMIMAAAFNEAGIPAEHLDQSHTKEERDNAVEKLSKGLIKVICSIGIMSTGSDIPCAEIGIMARPTMSEVLYVQQVGRLLRPFKICTCGKEFGAESVCHSIKYKKPYAIILDHADNTSRHGLPYLVRDAQLKDKAKGSKRNKDDQKDKIKECAECFGVYSHELTECPYCGHKPTPIARSIVTKDGELVEYTEGQLVEKYKSYKRQQEFLMLKFKKDKKWLANRMYKNFGPNVFRYSNELKMDFTDVQREQLLQSTSTFIKTSHARSTKGVPDRIKNLAATRRTLF